MIMSLKAASLGLNMVAACHVLLLDLWWNPTTEDQAIDRAHRIGQTRPVTVSRLTVENTVEDRILALQVHLLLHLKLPFKKLNIFKIDILFRRTREISFHNEDALFVGPSSRNWQ